MSAGADLWLVRHGETEWSRTGRHTGVTDIPLTAGGEQRAAALEPLLAARSFALVLSSPRARARETARLAGFPDPEIDDDLCEWDYGAYEGLTTAQIREKSTGWTIWNGDPPGGETAAQVAARARRVVERAEAAGGDVLLFAHGHFLRVLTAVALGMDAREGARFALDAGATGIVGWEHEYRTLRGWNVGPAPAS